MNILEEIVEVKKHEAEKLKREYPLSRFTGSPFFSLPSLSFKDSLSKNDSIAVIGEIKKASPSKGIIREDFNHADIARTYFGNGIDAVSILTDEQFFRGSINYLNEIAGFKKAPLLRKDFIIDEYQVYEARANGADAVLLIAEILSAAQITELTKCAQETGLDVLLEIHSTAMINKIDFTLNKIIGVNNRDLSTFKVDINATLQTAAHLPEGIILVSESGIKTKNDFDLLKKSRVNAVLIGEYFMREDNIADGIKRIKEWSRLES